MSRGGAAGVALPRPPCRPSGRGSGRDPAGGRVPVARLPVATGGAGPPAGRVEGSGAGDARVALALPASSYHLRRRWLLCHRYGLGWLFISQTLFSLHPEILQQLRIFFFGFGLALGQEFQALRQLVGSSEAALNLYQLFRDPHSAFDVRGRQYSFMTTGPVSPLSFSGSPLFFNAFNSVSDFLAANGLPVQQPMPLSSSR